MNLTTLLLLTSLSLVHAGGFANSCTNAETITSQIELVYKLRANCRKTSGQTITGATLNLHNCIGNSNGQLVRQKNGGWSTTCARPKSVSTTGVISTQCRNTAGNMINTSLDLNVFVSNQNGVLVCD